MIPDLSWTYPSPGRFNSDSSNEFFLGDVLLWVGIGIARDGNKPDISIEEAFQFKFSIRYISGNIDVPSVVKGIVGDDCGISVRREIEGCMDEEGGNEIVSMIDVREKEGRIPFNPPLSSNNRTSGVLRSTRTTLPDTEIYDWYMFWDEYEFDV